MSPNELKLVEPWFGSAARPGRVPNPTWLPDIVSKYIGRVSRQERERERKDRIHDPYIFDPVPYSYILLTKGSQYADLPPPVHPHQP